MSHFRLISTTKASDVIPVNKYVSEKTGLTVIIANVEGPIVNGYFCLATEAHDDDGLPHTLEHLVFLGSDRYPYKGILDLLANRCMANGTNAWTATDHTCYTICTAGDEGMLTLLPIYLDHILNPTLTEEGFVTEVHHIDGNGDDAGVVYCEMQGRENDADSRCELRLLRAMYPNSGYSAQTGGIMQNLRTSTSNTKVRNFHKKFYRAENMTIILTGQIAADDVFAALATVEDDIIAKRQKEFEEEWVKPWQTVPPPPLYGEIEEQWPADTEDCGQIFLGWRGPILTDPAATKELTACNMLLRYLCESAAAPLQRCLVEIEDALAGDVSYNLSEYLASMIKIELQTVPIDKLEAAKEVAVKCLEEVRSGDDPIDMDRMCRLLKKQLCETLAGLESDPHQAISTRAIADSLYSRDEEDFMSKMNPQTTLYELLEENSDYWVEIMQKYFTDDKIVIVGAPSTEMLTKMADEEKQRIEDQRAELGEEGLLAKAETLKNAIEFNERPSPPGVLAAVPVPSCANFKCYTISTWSSKEEQCPYFDLADLPFYARVHSLKTNFVYINLMFDTTEVDQKTRQWIPLLLNALGECPVWRDGTLIPHEDVISALEQITVAMDSNIGFGRSENFSVGIFGNLIHMEVTCEPENYEEVVNLLYEVLYSVEMTKERLLVFTQRLINEVAEVRRDGNKMMCDILRDSVYSKDSNVHWCSVLRQHKFLKSLEEQLNAGGESADAVIRDAKQTFKNITENVWLHLATDFERYKLSTEPWKKYPTGNNFGPVEPTITWDADLMSGWGGGFVVGVGGVESTYLGQSSPGPLGYDIDVAAPLMVALNYFTQLEGPMWRLIRGNGLSYSCGVGTAGNEGRIVFSLYKATNAVAAYSKAKAIIDEFLAGKEFDEDLFASARSTAVFDVVQKEKCPADVISMSLMNYLKRVGEKYCSELVVAVANVTPAAAHAAAERWLPSLFDATASKLAIVCHPSKVTDVQAAFDKIDIKLDAFESMEASHFNK